MFVLFFVVTIVGCDVSAGGVVHVISMGPVVDPLSVRLSLVGIVILLLVVI